MFSLAKIVTPMSDRTFSHPARPLGEPKTLRVDNKQYEALYYAAETARQPNRAPHDGIDWSDYKTYTAICPKCRRVHRAILHKGYGDNAGAWRLHGYLAVRCPICKRRWREGAPISRGSEGSNRQDSIINEGGKNAGNHT